MKRRLLLLLVVLLVSSLGQVEAGDLIKDITDAYLTNTTFDTNLDGWTNDGPDQFVRQTNMPSGGQYTTAFAEIYGQNVTKTGKIHQTTLTSLPAGSYRLTAKCVAGTNEGTGSDYLYATISETPTKADVTWMSGDVCQSITMDFKNNTTQNIEVGFVKNTTKWWSAIDDVKLYAVDMAAVSIPLPNSAVTIDTWYRFTTESGGDAYTLSSTGDATITWTTDGTLTNDDGITNTWSLTSKQNVLLAPSTTYYIKSSAAVTLTPGKSSVNSSYVSGWEKVTSISQLQTNPEDYFFAIFSANNTELMVRTNSSDGIPYYITAASPFGSTEYLYEIANYTYEATSCFVLQSCATNAYFYPVGNNAFDLFAPSSGKKEADDVCRLTFEVANEVWNVKTWAVYDEGSYWGLWDPANGYGTAEKMAGNKRDAAKGSFIIYRIAKDGLNMTSLITNPSFKNSDMSCWTFDNITNTGDRRESGGSSDDDSFHGAFWKQDYNSAIDQAPGLHQSVTLPAGFYRLEFDAYNNNGSGHTWKEVQLYFGDTKSSELAYNTTYNSWRTFGFEFEVTETTTANLGAKFTPTENGSIWEHVDNFRLTYLGPTSIKPSLLAEITNANSIYNGGANVGTGVFQIPTADGTTFSTAISTAQGVYNDASATVSGIFNAIDALKDAEKTYANATLNAPDAEKRYCIVVATEGHPLNGLAVGIKLGTTSDNNPTGYTISTNNTTNQSVAFTQVSGNSYNISFETAAGTTYLTYGTENGSAASWKDSQIQATTEDSKKGNFTIAATNKANVFNIYNIHTNSTIACQDGGNIYTQAGNADFTLVEATAANMAVNATAKWGTFCAPFEVAIPDGVTAYTCASATDGKLVLVEVTTGAIPANTPVILNAESGLTSTTFYGKKVDNDTDDLITEGLLVGNVSTSTKAVPSDGSAYLLQLRDAKVGFYKANGTGYLIGNNRCYLVKNLSGAREAFFFEDDATAISALEAAKAEDGALKDGKYMENNRIFIVKNGVKYGANGQKLN